MHMLLLLDYRYVLEMWVNVNYIREWKNVAGLFEMFFRLPLRAHETLSTYGDILKVFWYPLVISKLLII